MRATPVLTKPQFHAKQVARSFVIAATATAKLR
jgi:hypothetical protein